MLVAEEALARASLGLLSLSSSFFNFCMEIIKLVIDRLESLYLNYVRILGSPDPFALFALFVLFERPSLRGTFP